MFTLSAAEGEAFIDRDKLLNEMVVEFSDLSSTDGFAIYGIRRAGKTSLLLEVKRHLESGGKVVVAYVSVWNLVGSSLREFCTKVSEEVIASYAPYIGLKFKAAELLKSPLSLLRKVSELKVVAEDLEFLISFRQDEGSINELVERTFSMSEKLAEETGKKCVLIIDEFPSIVDLKLNGSKAGMSIVRKIRSLSEGWKRTALCISGSIKSTMDLVALSSASPFYRQFIVKELKPLEEEDVVEFLQRNLSIDKRAAGEAYRFSGGIPFYIQFLGKILTRKKERITLEDVMAGEKEFLTEEGNLLFFEEFGRLSDKDRLVLRAMVSGNRTVAEIHKDLRDEVSNVGTFLRYLEDKGVIKKKERGRYYIIDPVFEEWLALRTESKTFIQQVYDALKVPGTMQELYTLFPERPEPSVRGTVYRLINRGLVKRTAQGKYKRT